MSSVPVDQLSGADKATLACTYAALVLHDDAQQVTGAKIADLLKASKVEIQSFWPGLFAKSLEGQNIGDLLTPSAGGAAPAAVAGGSAPAQQATKAAEEKPAEEEEGDFDMGDMFG